MGNQQKKRGFILSFAILAVLLAGCMVFLHLAGLRGKIDFLQEASRIFAALGIFSTLPRWFLYALLSGTLFVLCCYGIYRLKTQKQRYGVLILGLFLAFWLNSLCYLRSVFFLFMTLVVVGLFAVANIPPAVGIAITKGLATQDSTGDNTISSCRRKLRRMEWVRFFPLKRFLAGCMWVSCLALAIMGIIAYCRNPETDSLSVIALLLAAAALTARKVWRYITTAYPCVPVLNKIFSREEIVQLLAKETFTQFPLEDASLQTNMPVLVSEHWIFIEGFLISRQLLLGVDVLRSTLTTGDVYRRSSRLVFFYLDGSKIQTRKTNLYLTNENSQAIKKALDEIAGSSVSSACKPASIAEKYRAILPQLQDPKEKLRYLLTHDIGDIRQQYAEFRPKR